MKIAEAVGSSYRMLIDEYFSLAKPAS